MSDLLINNGYMVNGIGSPAPFGDVRISGRVITEVGLDPASRGNTVVDDDGTVVAPGFNDCHTHFDANLSWDLVRDPLIRHGVIHCGRISHAIQTRNYQHTNGALKK